MKTCYIFGASEGLPKELILSSDDIVIAADAGIENLKKFDLKPKLIVGDFDSLGYTPDGNNIIKHPTVKDDTDMMLAVKKGFEMGFTRFVIYGGTGKRPDHTFANIQLLKYIADNGGIGFLCFDKFTATVIENNKILFSENAKGTVSVFSLSEQAELVNIEGLFYKLKGATVTNGFPIGVSNEFINQKASISVKSGALLIIWQGGTDCLE